MLNSGYGAFANEYFRYYDIRIASAITLTGQLVIRYVSDWLKTKLGKYIDIIYNDTDSCGFNTIVKTNQGNFKISDLYNQLFGIIEIRGIDNYIKHVIGNTTCLSYNIDNRKVEEKKIKYIMKHKVNKRMYLVKYNGKEVEITEDHSIIVNRNDIIISVKPKEILLSDKLIYI